MGTMPPCRIRFVCWSVPRPIRAPRDPVQSFGGKWRRQRISSYELLVRKSGGVQNQSSHVPAPASQYSRRLIAVRRPSAVHAVMPVWRGVTLIPDRITKAANWASPTDCRCFVRACRASLCGFWSPQRSNWPSGRHEGTTHHPGGNPGKRQRANSLRRDPRRKVGPQLADAGSYSFPVPSRGLYEGMDLLIRHGGPHAVRVLPSRGDAGEITFSTPATPATTGSGRGRALGLEC